MTAWLIGPRGHGSRGPTSRAPRRGECARCAAPAAPRPPARSAHPDDDAPSSSGPDFFPWRGSLRQHTFARAHHDRLSVVPARVSSSGPELETLAERINRGCTPFRVQENSPERVIEECGLTRTHLVMRGRTARRHKSRRSSDSSPPGSTDRFTRVLLRRVRTCQRGYSGDVRGHRSQIAEEARREVREGQSEDGAGAAADPRPESGGEFTGEEQAAANRQQDPPA